MEHTPTPWAAYNTGSNSLIVVPDEDGEFQRAVASLYEIDSHAQDAAFIVRAVNAHDALVEALDGAWFQIAALTATPDSPDFRDALRNDNPADNECLVIASEIIRAALKLAKKAHS